MHLRLQTEGKESLSQLTERMMMHALSASSKYNMAIKCAYMYLKRCGGRGHIQKECSSTGNDGDGMSCYKCGGKGIDIYMF